jgi:signal transduction histidine kinase
MSKSEHKGPLKRGHFILSLSAGLALAAVSIFGFTLMRHRPGLPREIDRSSVMRLDASRIETPDELHFVLSRKSVGEWVTVELRTADGTEARFVRVVPFYSQAPFPVIFLVIGLINLGIGTAVFVLRRDDSLARIFYAAMVCFSCTIIINGEFYGVGKSGLTYLPGFLFNILYPLCPALLLHFSMALSGRPRRSSVFLIYGTAALLSLAVDGLYLAALFRGSLTVLRWELKAVYALRLFIVAAVTFTVPYLILRFRKTERRGEKAQILWLSYGFVLGLGPFLFLYQLPRILGGRPLLSEELSTVFFVLVPLAFAVAIFRFKLMHIDLVINRSLVYAILTILTVSVYLLSLQALRLVAARFFKPQEIVLSLVATVVAAALFDPGRRRVQTFVDKSFFRQSYDARRAVLHFSEKAQVLADEDRLADFFRSELARVLPTERLDMAVHRTAENGAGASLVRGERAVVDVLEPAARPGGPPLARRQSVRFSDGLDFSRESLLEKCRIELALPMAFSSPSLSGFLALGRKKSGERFSADDLELLSALLSELAVHLERVKLQEEVAYERASKEKLDELNRLKTEFISSVSHELRTPLSSLQGLVEILQSGTLKDEARREKVLEIMAGESSRLSRFLHNILDYGKMEQNAKAYDVRDTDLPPLVEEAAGLFRFSGEAQGVTLTLDLPASPIVLKLDRDAVKQALINLIDNALKYSVERKEVEVSVVVGDSDVEVRVRDWGIGIAPEERDKVFDKFYRAASASRHNPQGVGLGLKIVKHIMEAHGGTVRVESAPGRGTVFILAFPRT